FISVLEDSGYMARIAVVMDRVMEIFGLNGKAFIPMIIGFGCNVPGIMAARSIHESKERTLTILVSPFMSCSARLPVYALFV
ncbi:ferrous iron transport protein B, partial [Listeria monocytogenes]|nr:ferrous iron transport protein B [Listeria monocytogenes]